MVTCHAHELQQMQVPAPEVFEHQFQVILRHRRLTFPLREIDCSGDNERESCRPGFAISGEKQSYRAINKLMLVIMARYGTHSSLIMRLVDEALCYRYG